MSFAAFLEVEIIDNSFSLPGAKTAFFLWCVCLLEAEEFGGVWCHSVGGRSFVQACVMVGLFSHLLEAIIRFLVFAFRQIKI